MTEHTTATDPTTNATREANGRFAKGNPGGPGNPFARKSAALRQALLDSVTPQDITDIATILIFNAKSGDLASVKLLFQYVIGKPPDAVNPDTLDLNELTLLQASSMPSGALKEFTGKIPPELALDILHAVQPEMTQHLLEGIAATVPPREAAPPSPPVEQPSTPSPQPAKRRERPPSPDGPNGRSAPPDDADTLDPCDQPPSPDGSNGGFAALARLLRLFPSAEQNQPA